MKHLQNIFDQAANLMDYPDDLSQESFLVYELVIEQASLFDALGLFNKLNPLKVWNWPFILNEKKYQKIDTADAMHYLTHFITEHLRYENGGSIEILKIERLAAIFLGGKWNDIYVNHKLITSNSCGFSIVRCPECHESFMALIGTDKVRIFNCFEGD